ncbi:CAP domain-containing protein [Chlorogloeopsis sp. ULAP01]|uniref:CAP domain-containing protein n=1 Tax=Chlorogloeopsis sp. ULAP01 TaxID=3056483 RepID=UPI0025AB29FA|nr:CAP domain-containing protein [Chlorogloeopsis sp. ULAP01]MDM9379765.1 CAP domain-containing protein [Chlorogloeopsis sp. ULAP01]
MTTFRKYWIARVAGIAITLLTTGCEQALEYLPPLPRVEIPTQQPAKPSIPVQTAKTAEIEAGVRQSINQVREQNGLKPLQNNERLADVARNYSRQMAEKNFFSHTGADGSTVETRVRAGGISYWVVGENLFKGRNISQPVEISVDGWLKSPGHRANIMRPYFTETGVGVWRDGNTYYITQLFLRR